MDRHRAAELTAALAAAVTAVIVALGLLPLPRRRPDLDLPAVSTDDAPVDQNQDLAADTVVRPGFVEYEPEDSDATITSPPPVAAPDLKRTAQVCTDLGRISDGDELQELLGQARELLNASGLIVWVRDSNGRALRAATGEGYAPQVLSRFGYVACDADNATATAYRTAQLQVVTGEDGRLGAVAVPLIAASPGPGRCIGVLSAEVMPGREASEALQATASILAAQLATIVSGDLAASEIAEVEVDTASHAAGGI